MKVTIDVDDKLFEEVKKKWPQLAYEDSEVFVRDAVSRRFEDLLVTLEAKRSELPPITNFQEVKGDEMVPVKIEVVKGFLDFAKAYIGFFGKETTLEVFCREAVYDSIRAIYKELRATGKGEVRIPTGISKEDWLGKFKNIDFIYADVEGPDD